MSVWKKAQKTHQKTPRERHQPEERQHLGLLEKKKDYVVRAKDINTKKSTLKLLRKRALNKNPDEFYHHMINARVDDGKHVEAEIGDEDTPEQLKFKRTEDLTYISFKRTQELKKIERLQSQLHLTSVNHGQKNKKIVFPKNLALDCHKAEANEEEDEQEEITNVNFRRLEQGAKKKRAAYRELARRIERERELAVIHEKLSVARRLECEKTLLKPTKVQKGTKNSAPVYKWKYERKK